MAFAMCLSDIHHIYLYNKNNISRKVKTSYNLERMEYYLQTTIFYIKMLGISENTDITMGSQVGLGCMLVVGNLSTCVVININCL